MQLFAACLTENILLSYVASLMADLYYFLFGFLSTDPFLQVKKNVCVTTVFFIHFDNNYWRFHLQS